MSWSSDSAISDTELGEITENNRTVQSPSRSPKGKSPVKNKTKRKTSAGTSRGSVAVVIPVKAEPKAHLDLIQEWSLPSDDNDDDLVVSSDGEKEQEEKKEVKPAKRLNRRQIKQLGTVLDVDQLRKLSAGALVLKFSRHTTSKVPRDETTFNYQHQYACTMLPGICSEKFCGNSLDTRQQIKRHLLRHIGELLTMTNQGKGQGFRQPAVLAVIITASFENTRPDKKWKKLKTLEHFLVFF